MSIETPAEEMALPVLLSERGRFYPETSDTSIEVIETGVLPAKAILSEFGWAFLVNDENGFSAIQSGVDVWAAAERSRAADIMRARRDHLAQAGVQYIKFIIPEKSVVYSEYLPRAVETKPSTNLRPAQMMAEDNPGFVAYLDRYLIDAKSYGLLFFRGDTHTNWFGAWLVYRAVVECLVSRGAVEREAAYALVDLVSSIAGYDGDLRTHVDVVTRKQYEADLGFMLPSYGFENTIKLDLRDDRRRANLVAVPEDYEKWFPSRKTFVYECADRAGLRAVIFRDSTADLCLDLLAQHFARAVFVWHNGLVYAEIIEREKPDIVIHLMAERFVTRYRVFPAIATLGPF